jgi:DNA-binding transcriptional regulator GbsR (MarR family)
MSDLHPIVRRFIEDAGNATQSFGVGRVLGLIYAYLYFSPEPRGLSDLQTALGISKGSASTGVRQLEQWSAVRKVWVRGDRKDYYEANDWFGQILKNAVLDAVGKRIASSAALLSEAETRLAGATGNGDEAFIRARLAHVRRFQKRVQAMWDSRMLRRLLRT